MERLAPAGDTYQAGTLSGNPLATAAGLATLRAARRERRTSGSSSTPSGSPAGCARRPPSAGVPVHVAADCGLLTVFFRERAGRPTTRAPQAADARRLRALLQRDARARGLPAAVAVRGLVPVARARRRRDRAHARGCGRGLRGGRRDAATQPDARSTRLRAELEAEGGPLATALAAAGRPGREVFGPLAAQGDARQRRRTSTRCSSRASSRAICSITRGGRIARPRRPRPAPARAATTYMRFGLARLARARRPRGGRRAGRPDQPLRAGARVGRRRAELAPLASDRRAVGARRAGGRRGAAGRSSAGPSALRRDEGAAPPERALEWLAKRARSSSASGVEPGARPDSF